MARASAWLALAFGVLQVSFSLYGSVSSLSAFDGPLYLKIYTLLPGLLCLAGGAVVLRRVKPGLRLLSAAWAFSVGAILAKMTEAIAHYEVIRRHGQLSTKVGEASDDPAFPIHLSQLDTLALIVAVIGLGLALSARRPHHKN